MEMRLSCNKDEERDDRSFHFITSKKSLRIECYFVDNKIVMHYECHQSGLPLFTLRSFVLIGISFKEMGHV